MLSSFHAFIFLVFFWHTYRVAYTSTGTGLFGDETGANHLTCELLGILCAVAEDEHLRSQSRVDLKPTS